VVTGRPWFHRLPNTFFALDFLRKVLAMRRLAAAVPEDVDVINAHPYPSYVAGYWVKKRRGTPVVYHSNDAYLLPHQWIAGMGTKGRKAWGGLRGLNLWPCFVYERAVFHRLDRLIVSCRWLQQNLKETYNVDASIVPAGVDIDKFQPAPRDEAL